MAKIWIERLNRAGIEMRCDNTDIGLRAQGNEPGWRVQSDSKAVRLVRQGQPDLLAPPGVLAWHWTQSAQHRPEGVLQVQTESAAYRLRLTPRQCRDTMADAVYGMTASLVVQRPEPAMTYTGCAYLGSERMP
jgi:uncharacterized membrane protein